MNINFELYKVFYFVAKHRSFSEAAKHLYISQSAVSQAIRQLEDMLVCRLFIRTTKQVSLTVEGEQLYQHIEQAFNLIKTGERSLQEIQELKAGEVKIAASDTICKYYLLPYFRHFSQLYPQIKIRVTNRTSPVCIDLVKKGEVDIGVVNIPTSGNIDSSLAVTKENYLHDVFIAGQAFSQLQDKKIPLARLAELPLILLEKNSVSRLFFDALMNKHHLTIAPEFELGSIDLLIDMAKIGMGIGFVPQEYVDFSSGDLFTLHTSLTVPARTLGVVTSKSIPLPLAAQKFVDLLE